MTTSTDIGILVTGRPPADLAERYGGYDAMMRRMLGDGYRYRSYDIANGEAPVRPQDHAAYIITGSAAGVYDPLPWIEPLQGFIRAAHRRTKLVGICFGHQIMAQALGGQVEKSSKGWGLGLHRYDIVGRANWMDQDAAAMAGAATHQDQVVVLPPQARVLAASAFTPFAALSYAGEDAISVQFHPEFPDEFAAELLDVIRPRLADPSLADRALASLHAPGDAPRIAAWIRRFLDEPSRATRPQGP